MRANGSWLAVGLLLAACSGGAPGDSPAAPAPAPQTPVRQSPVQQSPAPAPPGGRPAPTTPAGSAPGQGQASTPAPTPTAAQGRTASWLGSLVVRGERIEQIDIDAEGRCVRLCYHGLRLDSATATEPDQDVAAAFARLAQALRSEPPSQPEPGSADDATIELFTPTNEGAPQQHRHVLPTLPTALRTELQTFLTTRAQQPGAPAGDVWFAARDFATAMGLPRGTTAAAIQQRLQQRGVAWQQLLPTDVRLLHACARPGLLVPGDTDVVTTPEAPKILEVGGAFYSLHAIRRP